MSRTSTQYSLKRLGAYQKINICISDRTLKSDGLRQSSMVRYSEYNARFVQIIKGNIRSFSQFIDKPHVVERLIQETSAHHRKPGF